MLGSVRRKGKLSHQKEGLALRECRDLEDERAFTLVISSNIPLSLPGRVVDT
jgi:hypothetical protein